MIGKASLGRPAQAVSARPPAGPTGQAGLQCDFMRNHLVRETRPRETKAPNRPTHELILHLCVIGELTKSFRHAQDPLAKSMVPDHDRDCVDGQIKAGGWRNRHKQVWSRVEVLGRC